MNHENVDPGQEEPDHRSSDTEASRRPETSAAPDASETPAAPEARSDDDVTRRDDAMREGDEASEGGGVLEDGAPEDGEAPRGGAEPRESDAADVRDATGVRDATDESGVVGERDGADESGAVGERDGFDVSDAARAAADRGHGDDRGREPGPARGGEEERGESAPEADPLAGGATPESPPGLESLFGKESPFGKGSPFGSGAPFGPGSALGADGTDGDIDEEALRQLLRVAVDDLEPSRDALDHLRRAVPARRARRRQALVGAAAAVLLGGAALPALFHVATTSSGSNDRPANAASSERTPGVHGGSHGEGSDGKQSGKPSEPGDKDKKDKEKDEKGKGDKEKHSKSPTYVPGPDPSSTLNATSPICTRAQLGGSSASAGPADANGHVYGSFQVVNISTSACTIDGSGVVSAVAQGSADATQIAVVDHTPGDAATQLPDAPTTPTQLIIQPGQAFEVRFAWIPASGGGPSGCTSTGATPTPEPTQDGGPDSVPEEQPSSGEPGGDAGGGGEEPPEASVQINYTPAAGDPVAAGTTVSNACAGTVYRTGVLAG
ncbi:DUF4232 domain-containing protein [Streptomyces sp. NPDC018031]|uniref:DUF4232 domain-containing protein n=1 Tax=Streptomyces sp. NPDC018031 TaxID=3365033 RepID=UPI0037BDBD3D